MSRTLLALAVIAVSGLPACAEPPAPPASSAGAGTTPAQSASANLAPTAAPTSEGAIAAPFSLTIRGPQQVASGDQISLAVTLTRNVALTEPLDLTVRIPPGVTLVDGLLNERIVDAGVAPIVRDIRLHVDRVPTEDVRAEADVRGTGHGAHASAFYRFGRQEPLIPQPSGPPVPASLSGGPPRR